MFSVYFKDPLRASVEAVSGGKRTVIYDDKKNPSIMYDIPKFKNSDIDPSLGNDTHPAFIVEGKEVSDIFVGCYQSIVLDGRAYSLPHVDPTAYINFDTARGYCDAKGRGWHMTSNAERAAIALWCAKNGYFPRGNTSTGCAYDATYEHGVMGGDGRTLTGSGPQSWNHDNTAFGIADLCGNVWEWTDGLKFIDGKIYVVGQDSTPMNNFRTANTYKGTTGWIDTGACFDSSVAGSADKSGGNLGSPILNSKVTNKAYMGDSTEEYYKENDCAFESLSVTSGYTPPTYLKSLAVQPLNASGTGDYLWVRNYGERIPLCGGYWADSAGAGVFALNLRDPRSAYGSNVGFRVAYTAI